MHRGFATMKYLTYILLIVILKTPLKTFLLWGSFHHSGIFLTFFHFQDDQEDITSFALSCDDEVKHLNCLGHFFHVAIEDPFLSVFLLCAQPQLLVTASRALLLKQWDWRRAQCTRTWRAIHTVPVASMTFDSTSTLLATGQRRQDSLCLWVHKFLSDLLCLMSAFLFLSNCRGL